LPAKFRWDTSFHGWDKTTSGFGKRTTAILEFYFRFQFNVRIVIGMSFYICLPIFVVIGRLAAELWRHIDFSRWLPQSRKYTSVFRFSDGIWLGMWKSMSLPNFRFTDGIWLRMWKSICLPNFDEIPHSTAGIKLLPVSDNGRPSFWNSISVFDFDVCVAIGMSFCICLPNFVVIRRWGMELWPYIYFFKMAAGSHIGFDLSNVRPPTKCNCRSQLDPQIWFWSDLLFWRYCDFSILPFWLEIAFHAHFWGVLGAYFPKIWSPIVLNPKKTILARSLRFPWYNFHEWHGILKLYCMADRPSWQAAGGAAMGSTSGLPIDIINIHDVPGILY